MQIIPLRIVRYSDKHSILTAYSRDYGRISVLIPESKSKSAMRLKAMLQPLLPIECLLDMRPDREMAIMREPQPLLPLYDILVNPLKQTLTIFIADALFSLLRHPEPDPTLFDFVAQSVCALEECDPRKIANFHLVFMTRLTFFFGIEPDTTDYRSGDIFDMRDSIFRRTFPPHSDFLNPDEATVLLIVNRLSFRSMHLLKITRQQRHEILDQIIRYYELHDFPITPLRSLDIFRSIF